MKKIIGLSTGVLLLGLLYMTYTYGPLIRTQNTGKTLRGQAVSVKDIVSLRSGERLRDDGQRKLLILVSPTCPHCIRSLHILDTFKYTFNFKIIPIFSCKAQVEMINKVLTENSIALETYKMSRNMLCDSIKAVPAFIFVNSEGRIQNLHLGGVPDSLAFATLVTQLSSTVWSSRRKSLEGSHCSQ